MAKRQSLPHWLVPTTLLVSFIAGIALAVGHHYFYSRLHDRRVDQARWPQGTYVAIGTGRAFLVRAAFVITISTVYWQIFWQRLRKPLSLSTIDDLADQLKVIYQLFNWISLKASPLLGLLALLAWLIPLAVVFPPSALRVVPKEFRSHGIKEIHLPGYNKRDMFVNTYMLAKDQPTVMRGGGYDFDAEWARPTNRIRRTLFGAAYQGQLPSIPAPQANSSYDITFYAPSIQCMPISSPNEILRELDVAGIQCLNGSTACGTTFSTFYVSWVAESSIVPFNITSSLEDASLGIAEYVPFPYQDYVLPSDARLGTDDSRPQALYLAYRDNMAQKGLHSNDVALLNCMLYNATYTVSFNFNNGNQDVSINAIELQNVIFIESSRDRASCPGAFGLNTPEVQSYLAYMEVVGELLLVLHNSAAIAAIIETLEEIFQNMTLSLLTIPEIAAEEPIMSNVSLSVTHNAYRYNKERLFAAYGAATAGTFLTVVIGLYSLAVTGTSYSNKFSTVIRVARDQTIGVHIQHKDRLGQDPPPTYIGEAKLNLDWNELAEKSKPETFSRKLHQPDDSGGSDLNAKTAHVQTSLLRD